MLLSVVIPCFNAQQSIGELLRSLAEQQCGLAWEVVVADNGSTDDSVRLALGYKSRLPHLAVVPVRDRRGPGAARNAGAAIARGELLVFCDADDVPAAGWLAAMANALRTHPFVASRVDLEALNSDRARQGRGAPQRDGLQPYTYPRFLPHAGGSGLGVRRPVHDGVGGFDERLPVLEDTDYCWRIQLSGTPLVFAPDALLHVRLREGTGAMCRQSHRWARYNVLLYKRYRRRGMAPLSFKSGLRSGLDLVRRAPDLLRPDRRTAWLWQASWISGRLAGSLRYGVYAL